MDTPAAVVLRREPGPLVRSLVALILRVGLGLLMLAAGYNKLHPPKPEMAYSVEGMVEMFKATPLPAEAVRPFAKALPYAELYLGATLVVGLGTMLNAFLAGVLLLQLLVGLLVLGDPTAAPPMFSYLLVCAGVIWLSPVRTNWFSIDGLLFGWLARPRDEGEYAIK